MFMKSCAVCNSSNLNSNVIDKVFNYEGFEAVVHGYQIVECMDCGEQFTDPASDKMAEPIIRDLHRRAENLLTSDQIKLIRQAYGFTQENLSSLLGGGLKAMARYENGSVMQSRSMNNLLRIIWDHPEVISSLYQYHEHAFSPATTLPLATVPYQLKVTGYSLKEPAPVYHAGNYANDFQEVG